MLEITTKEKNLIDEIHNETSLTKKYVEVFYDCYKEALNVAYDSAQESGKTSPEKYAREFVYNEFSTFLRQFTKEIDKRKTDVDKYDIRQKALEVTLDKHGLFLLSIKDFG